MPRSGTRQTYAGSTSPGSFKQAESEAADDAWSAGESNTGDPDGEPDDEGEDGGRKRKIRPLSVSCELVGSAYYCVLPLSRSALILSVQNPKGQM